MSKEDKSSKSWFARHKILTAILAVIILAALVNAMGGSKTNTTSDSKSSSKSSQNSSNSNPTAKVGEAVRDGKFEFVVKGLECGKPTVGANEYITKTAQGQYCLLSVTVKNIGNEKQSLFSANQKLLNGKVEYSADDTATLYAAPQGSSWYSDINPGNSVEGTIVFDVPKDVTPTVAELHDSAYSGGAKVNLQ